MVSAFCQSASQSSLHRAALFSSVQVSGLGNYVSPILKGVKTEYNL